MNLFEKFHQQFAIPVLRQNDGKTLSNIAEALIDGGMTTLEITLMSDEAFQVISMLSKKSNVSIGAGTVLNEEQTKRAIDNGATFLVSPGLEEKSVMYAQKQKIPFIPGVLTPTEVLKAVGLNCEVVKVFPISAVGGASYLKSLQGPFPKLKFMATGGITPQNIESYLSPEVLCVGLGNNITPAHHVNSGNWKALTQLAQEILQNLKKVRTIE